MRRRTALRLIALVLVAVGTAGWVYPYWRFTRDRRAAEEALAAYDFPAAREYLARCAAYRPSDPNIQLLACRAARRDGDLGAAEEHYLRYREQIGKSNPDATLERALLDAQTGKVGAVDDFLVGHVDAGHARSEEIMEALALGNVVIYQFKPASYCVNYVLERWPRNPICRLLQAQAEATLGRRDKAVGYLRELIRDFPRHVGARLTLGETLLMVNQPGEAIDEFDEVRRLKPGEPIALLGLARSLHRAGRMDRLRELVPELEGRTSDSEALLHLGRFAMTEQRWADADRYLSRAVQLAPFDHEIHKELAVALHQLGRTDEAHHHAERVRAIEADLARVEKLLGEILKSPGNPELRLEAGRIYLRLGQTTEGLRWLAGALDVAPDHKATHKELADYFAASGNPEREKYHRAMAQ